MGSEWCLQFPKDNVAMENSLGTVEGGQVSNMIAFYAFRIVNFLIVVITLDNEPFPRLHFTIPLYKGVIEVDLLLCASSANLLYIKSHRILT